MRVLAIDSSSPAPSLALLLDDGTVRVRPVSPGAIERLARHVSELLAENGLTVRDLDRVAVLSGPGSFTGLRAGTAFARGLARGAGIPLVAIPTFEAASLGLAEPPDADLLLDAGRHEVHVARRRNGELGAPALALGTEAEARAARDGVPCLAIHALGAVLSGPAALLAARWVGPAERSIALSYGRASAAEEKLRAVSPTGGTT